MEFHLKEHFSNRKSCEISLSGNSIVKKSLKHWKHLNRLDKTDKKTSIPQLIFNYAHLCSKVYGAI